MPRKPYEFVAVSMMTKGHTISGDGSNSVVKPVSLDAHADRAMKHL